MIEHIFIHNFFKILFVNFYFLPFRQAIRFPIDVYGKLRIVSKKGKIIIRGNVDPGMIKLGSQGRDMFPLDPVVWDIRGTIEFCGGFYIGCGSTIRVEDNASLILGNGSRFGAQSLIFCEENIKIGNQVEGSWKCQLMDCDRHKIRNPKLDVVFDSCKPIDIGNNVWIGNNVLINKGTTIPNNTIVASYSLCNKDYSDIEENSIIGGIPACVISTCRQRIW